MLRMILVVFLLLRCPLWCKEKYPEYENRVLASYYDKFSKTVKIVTVFDVFGIPSWDSKTPELTNQQRDYALETYLLQKLMEQKGREQYEKVSKDLDLNRYLDRVKKIKAIKCYKYDHVNKEIYSEENMQQFWKQRRHRFLKSYDESRERLERIFRIKNKDKLKSKSEEVFNKLLKDMNVYVNWQVIDSIVNSQYIFKKQLQDIVSERFTPSTVLVSWKDKKSNISDLLKIIKGIPDTQVLMFHDKDHIKMAVGANIFNAAIEKKAKEDGYFQDPRVISEINKAKMIYWGKKYAGLRYNPLSVIVPKDSMLAYYKRNKDANELKCNKKMDVREIFLYYNSNEKKIETVLKATKLRNKILENDSLFDNYAAFYNRKLSKDGRLGYIFNDGSDYYGVSKVADTLKVGEISELLMFPNGVSFITVKDIIEPQRFKFHYVERYIKQKLQIQEIKKRKLSDKDILFAEYKVKLQ